MVKETITITKLTPSEGMVLTNGKTYAPNGVHVGKNGSSDNWREITVGEYERIMAEQESEG